MRQITIGHLGHFILDYFGQIWTQGILRHILGSWAKLIPNQKHLGECCGPFKVDYYFFDTFMKA